MPSVLSVFAALLLLLFALPVGATAAEKIIFDTDIGDDIDDVYALALLVSEPNINILGVTTCLGDTPKRSALTARMLKVMEKAEIPVYTGRQTGKNVGRQHEWALGYRSRAMKTKDAVTFMREELMRAPGEITLLAVGPLMNLGDLLTKHPEVKPHIKRIVMMGGSAYVGYDNKPPAKPEYNIFTDVAAAKVVFESGVPIVMAGLDVTTMLQLDIERQRKLFALGVPMTDALAALTKLWEQRDPTLFDPMAVAYALGHKFCDSEKKRVVVNAVGLTQIVEGTPNVEVLINPRKDEFLDWYVKRIIEFAQSRKK